MSAVPALPTGLRFIRRDWLSANHILLRSAAGHVLVDTGYVTTLETTRRLLCDPDQLGNDRLAAIVNTHCHSDHMGGNAALAREHGCPIHIPAGEAPHVDAWDERALLLGPCGQQAEPFRYDALLVPGSRHRWGDMDWDLLAAPGHDDGALMFHCAEHGLLVSGDALWEHGFGFVPAGRPEALDAARDTLERIAALRPRCILPGHGAPFTGVEAAIERCLARVEGFRADPVRLARHGVRVLLAFTLLARGRLALASLPALLEDTPFYGEVNAAFLRQPWPELAGALCEDLLRAGVARAEDGWLVPSGGAG